MPLRSTRLPAAPVLAAGLLAGAASVPTGPVGPVVGLLSAPLLVLAAGGALRLGARSRHGLLAALALSAAAAGAVRAAAAQAPRPPPGLDTGPGRLELIVTRASPAVAAGRAPSTPGAAAWVAGRQAGPRGAAEGPVIRVRIPQSEGLRRTGRRAPVRPGERALVSFGSLRTVDSGAHAGAHRAPRLIAHVAGPDSLRPVGRAPSPFAPLLRLSARARSGVRTRLTQATGDRGSAAVLACLLVGDRDGIPPSLRSAFRRAGLAHLLAVSGLHVVLLARVAEALLAAALSTRVRPRRRELVLAAVLLPALTAYALLCGLALPVVRACVFLVVARIARCVRRRSTTLDHLAVAATIMIIAAPGESRAPGFHLSFAAVAGLALLTPRFEEALFPGLAVLRAFPAAVPRWRLRVHTFFARAVSAALAAHVGAAPVVAAAFGDVHLVGPLANVPAVALTAWLLPAAAVGALCGGLLPRPGGALLRVATDALEGLAKNGRCRTPRHALAR